MLKGAGTGAGAGEKPGGVTAVFAPEAGAHDDASLAEAIEADGTRLIETGRAVELRRYLVAVPGLEHRPEPLDAAIDVTLRSLRAFGVRGADAVEQLAANYPSLEPAIRDAGALSEALVRTSRLRPRAAPARERALPAEFGPRLGHGWSRYRLCELLGRGSTGAVYRAVDRLMSEEGHEAEVAIKILDDAEGTAWDRERFAEEATKARRIDHPNVVRVLDRGVVEPENEEYIVYAFEGGGDLRARMERGLAATVREKVRIAAGIARGVQAAHSAGLVHCDLKPANVVFGADGTPRVADFGISVRRGQSGAPGAERIGNIAFISPEQFRAEAGALVPASDVYAIGGILYWMLTGSLPNGQSAEEIERSHARGGGAKAPSVRAAVGVDREVDAICARCLAPRVSDRYPSAAQVADDLEAWLRLEPIPWTRPPMARVLELWARRRPGVAALSALLVIGAAAAGVWIWNLRAEALAERFGREQSQAIVKVQKEQKAQAAATVSLLIKGFERILSEHERWEFLPMLAYLDWALGTKVFGDPDANEPPWDDRVRRVRPLVEQARSQHGPGSFQAVALETTLAFWLILERQPAEAEAILAANRAAWRRLLPPEQSWHQCIDALAACAAVRRLSMDRASPLSEDERRIVREGVDTLEAVYPTLRAGPHETQVGQLARLVLYEAYGPKMLADAKKRRRYAGDHVEAVGRK